jgi:anaerobic sulfite reductase subunit C
MAAINYKELKNNCFMRQTDKDRFSLRLRIAGGKINSEHLQKVYEISNKYGQGYVHLTSRQSIEIPFIKLEDIDAVKAELVETGLRQGVCGPRVRTITACQGCKVCPSGLIDTTNLAEEFDEQYYAQEVPHKFKIGITGCRNNCLKAEENDFGIKGAMQPNWEKEKCKFCGACEAICPAKVISVNKDEASLNYNAEECRLCGKCVKVCQTGAWEGKSGFTIYCGGLFGNRIQIGRQVIPIVFSKQELHKAVVAVLEFYRKHGSKGERFGNCLNRVGWELLEEELKPFIK